MLVSLEMKKYIYIYIYICIYIYIYVYTCFNNEILIACCRLFSYITGSFLVTNLVRHRLLW